VALEVLPHQPLMDFVVSLYFGTDHEPAMRLGVNITF